MKKQKQPLTGALSPGYCSAGWIYAGATQVLPALARAVSPPARASLHLHRHDCTPAPLLLLTCNLQAALTCNQAHTCSDPSWCALARITRSQYMSCTLFTQFAATLASICTLHTPEPFPRLKVAGRDTFASLEGVAYYVQEAPRLIQTQMLAGNRGYILVRFPNCHACPVASGLGNLTRYIPLFCETCNLQQSSSHVKVTI